MRRQKASSHVLLCLLLLLSGCSLPGATSPTLPPLTGRIEPFVQRGIAATSILDVAQGATISLIEPATGLTLATTVSQPDGRFTLNFGTAFLPGSSPYFLEVVKGIAQGGNPNRAGAPAIRLRTLIAFQGTGWNSLTGPSTLVGRGTTAIAVLSSLRAFSDAKNLALLGTILPKTPSSGSGITAPDTFTGTPDLPAADFFPAWRLVDQALSQDLDPIGSLFARPLNVATSNNTAIGTALSTQVGLAMAAEGLGLFSLSPANAAVGNSVTLHGHGLPLAGLAITLDGKACALGPVTNGTSVAFTVPAGVAAGTYPLVVTYGPWTSSALALTVN